jgi:hypothetical protein
MCFAMATVGKSPPRAGFPAALEAVTQDNRRLKPGSRNRMTPKMLPPARGAHRRRPSIQNRRR